MGDWWIDETPWPGPARIGPETLREALSEFARNATKAYIDGVRKTATDARRTSGALAHFHIDPRGNLTSTSPLSEATDKLMSEEPNLSIDTVRKLVAEMGNIDSRKAKVQVGRGNIAGHGPRGPNTFDRRGRRRY